VTNVNEVSTSETPVAYDTKLVNENRTESKVERMNSKEVIVDQNTRLPATEHTIVTQSSVNTVVPSSNNTVSSVFFM
jgi:hypothetical protein